MTLFDQLKNFQHDFKMFQHDFVHFRMAKSPVFEEFAVSFINSKNVVPPQKTDGEFSKNIVFFSFRKNTRSCEKNRIENFFFFFFPPSSIEQCQWVKRKKKFIQKKVVSKYFTRVLCKLFKIFNDFFFLSIFFHKNCFFFLFKQVKVYVT